MQDKEHNRTIDSLFAKLDAVRQIQDDLYDALIALRYQGAPKEFNASKEALGTLRSKADWLAIVERERLSELKQHAASLDEVPNVIRWEITGLRTKYEKSN